jgi:hypothetical protein
MPPRSHPWCMRSERASQSGGCPFDVSAGGREVWAVMRAPLLRLKLALGGSCDAVSEIATRSGSWVLTRGAEGRRIRPATTTINVGVTGHSMIQRLCQPRFVAMAMPFSRKWAPHPIRRRLAAGQRLSSDMSFAASSVRRGGVARWIRAKPASTHRSAVGTIEQLTVRADPWKATPTANVTAAPNWTKTGIVLIRGLESDRAKVGRRRTTRVRYWRGLRALMRDAPGIGVDDSGKRSTTTPPVL